MRLRKVLPEENRWWPFSVQQVMAVVPERDGRGLSDCGLRGDSHLRGGSRRISGTPYGSTPRWESEEAACIRAHGATQFLFTVIRANRATREGEHRELIEFYDLPC